MSEVFNSGTGGYICDACRILLWAGPKGVTTPDKRYFIYGTNKEDIVEIDGGIFCSSKCSATHLIVKEVTNEKT